MQLNYCSLQIQDTAMQQVQQQEVQIGQNGQFTTEMTNQNVTTGQELNIVTGSQQNTINALQAQIASGGHIIFTGGDTSQLSGILKFTVVNSENVFFIYKNDTK